MELALAKASKPCGSRHDLMPDIKKGKRVKTLLPLLIWGLSPLGMRSVVEVAAHAAHAAATATGGGCVLLLGQIHHDALGGQHHASDRGGIL